MVEFACAPCVPDGQRPCCRQPSGLRSNGDRLLPQNEQGIDRARLYSIAQAAAEQIRRCYRQPKLPSEVKQIVTRLRVRFTPDGQLAGLPQIVWQRSVTPETAPFAARMAEAASLAVIRCTPVSLPADAYAGGWEELDFTFSPRGVA